MATQVNSTGTTVAVRATGWKDLVGSITVKGSGANDPTWSTFRNGISAYEFSATTTVYKETAASGTAYQHMISEIADGDAVSGTNIEPDTLILVRIFRDAANGNDTCTDTAFLLTADCHYQSDQDNTKNKAPNFYD